MKEFAICRQDGSVVAKLGNVSKQDISDRFGDIDVEWSDDPDYVSSVALDVDPVL